MAEGSEVSDTSRECIFSPDRRYRYTLWRNACLSGTGYCAFIGLNPSTADETTDDPTIRRCTRFARDWGYRYLLMTNLFGFRATRPVDMFREIDPVGPENDEILAGLLNDPECLAIIAAWGVHGTHRDRDQWALRLFGSNLGCLGTTKEGQPRHPLYVPAMTEITSYGYAIGAKR
jgi:hypothetical protein